MKSVLQDWVMELGLRHQGVLLTAVRGCDTVPKHDPVKLLIRCYRNEVLNAHCDAEGIQPTSFIERVSDAELTRRMRAVVKDHDHYPLHYMMHLVHAAEVLGYKKPSPLWMTFYSAMCSCLHVTPETLEQLDARLGADEATFQKGQQ